MKSLTVQQCRPKKTPEGVFTPDLQKTLQLFLLLDGNVLPYSLHSKTKRAEDEDSEEDKMDKKKRRRIKKPEPDSSDEEGLLMLF